MANLNLGGCRSLEGGALEQLAPLKALRDLSLHDCARLPCIDAGLSTLTTLAGVSMLNLQVPYLYPCCASQTNYLHFQLFAHSLSMQHSREPRSNTLLEILPACPAFDAALSTLTTLAGVSMLDLQVFCRHPQPCAASSPQTAFCAFINQSM